MDKCILSSQDVETLLSWRDDNKHLVRHAPQPVKAIECVFPDVNTKIKYIRKSKDFLIVQTNINGHSLGALKLRLLPTGEYIVKQQPSSFDKENVMTCATVYFSLMALMAYGDGVDYTTQELEVLDSVFNDNRISTTTQPFSKKPSITYLLHRDSQGRVSVGGKGHHASPKGEFGVRGHFRHYKDGKVVWIEEYRKGLGKRTNKTYKL